MSDNTSGKTSNEGTSGEGSDAVATTDEFDSPEQIVEDVVEDVRSDIQLGHVVDDDVSNVLEERLDEVGVDLRPEAVDDLADDIENDASR